MLLLSTKNYCKYCDIAPTIEHPTQLGQQTKCLQKSAANNSADQLPPLQKKHHTMQTPPAPFRNS